MASWATPAGVTGGHDERCSSFRRSSRLRRRLAGGRSPAPAVGGCRRVCAPRVPLRQVRGSDSPFHPTSSFRPICSRRRHAFRGRAARATTRSTSWPSSPALRKRSPRPKRVEPAASLRRKASLPGPGRANRPSPRGPRLLPPGPSNPAPSPSPSRGPRHGQSSRVRTAATVSRRAVRAAARPRCPRAVSPVARAEATAGNRLIVRSTSTTTAAVAGEEGAVGTARAGGS